MDSEMLVVQLRNHHLPKLAEVGYVRWESDPFCVQRWPNFEELAFIIGTVLDSVDEIPDSLINNCKIFQMIMARTDRMVTNVIEAVAAADGVDPVNLDSLYEYIDPEVLEQLSEQDGTEWSFTFLQKSNNV